MHKPNNKNALKNYALNGTIKCKIVLSKCCQFVILIKFTRLAILKYTVKNNEINRLLYWFNTFFFHFIKYIERNRGLPFWRKRDLKISRHAISAVIYSSIHSNGFVSSQKVRWLTRLPKHWVYSDKVQETMR